MMKTSVLPPILHLDLIEGREYHLTLAHLCEDERYAQFYRRERSRGSYVILDNGAHEFQSGEGPKRLLQMAARINANEIVCPDFLFDADQTVSLARSSLPVFNDTSTLSTYFTKERVQTFRVMLVPQGSNYFAWRRCLHHLLEIYYQQGFLLPPVIGLSKDYEMFEGGLYRLINVDLIPLVREHSLDLHLLGWGRRMSELSVIAREFGSWIRSVDSAKPVVFATAGIQIDDLFRAPEYPTRPEGYFSMRLTSEQILLARQNMKVFDRAAQDGRR